MSQEALHQAIETILAKANAEILIEENHEQHCEVTKLQEKPKSWSQRMLEAGFTPRPSRRAIPDDE